jgi:putative ABC transport system permease protein
MVKKPMPPSLFHRLFRWYCRPQLLDHIEGDLLEVYGDQVSRLGKRKADVKFIIDVIKLFRPGIVRPIKGYGNLTNHDMLTNYFKIGWRNLLKRKGFAAINIAGLALGFCCSILIFLFINHHLQFDKFHHDAERIYRVVTEEHIDVISYSASVPPGFSNTFKADYPQVEKSSKIVSWEEELVTINESTKLKKSICFTENDFFDILNFPLVNNARISLKDPNTAFITEQAAKNMFGDQDPVGKTFQLGGLETISIIGVMKDIPATSVIKGDLFISFETLKNYDAFLASEGWNGINTNLQCFTKLRPGHNTDEIEKGIAGYVRKFRPNSKNVHEYRLQALSDIHFDPRYAGGINPRTLWAFGAIGLFLLIVASINFINISTAQSVSRSKEVGMRKVMGSTKSSLFWQFITETFLMTVFAFVISLGIVTAVLPYFNSLFGLELSTQDLLTPAFSIFSTSLLLGIAFFSGSYPGVVLARIAPLLALKGKVTQQHTGGLLTRRILVITQFTISIVLIIVTIGINKQIHFAVNSDLGYHKSEMLIVTLPDGGDSDKHISLKNEIAQLTGVEKVTACFGSPGASESEWSTSVRYDNRPETEEFGLQMKMADVDYLSTFGLELVAGRNFIEKDTVDEVVVNETFAKKLNLKSPEELLGKPIAASGQYIQGTIVGVVKDFHDGDFHQAINAVCIAPKKSFQELAIKINMTHASDLIQAIGNSWSNAYPEFIFEYEFLDDRVAKLYASDQRILSLTRLFSGLAIFIGTLGIYGLIMFLVAQKSKEIGIRKLLGGSVSHILVLVTHDFARLLAVAGVVASPLAWYLMNRWLENYTFKTQISWWVFALALGIVAMITLITISYQALKAAFANPVDSLKNE